MGRRRSKVQATQRMFRAARHTRMMQRMKPRAWDCPWCNEHGGMFTQLQGSGRLVLIGCSKCKQGERLPYHPTWKAIDHYHFIIDNARHGKIPEFSYDMMSAVDYDFIREHITLGKLHVADIVDEDD